MMKKFLVIMLIALTTAYFAYAETFRQGDERFTFNAANTASKTAAYTVTATDSQVNVTCSTADIVITLPTVASTRAAGSKTYKILKSDATAYAVIVTPATGDTIGGESTRYIITQNDYVVISPGNGDDWQVAFESPIIKEDYEVGTVTFRPTRVVKSLTAARTLSASACGGDFLLAASTTAFATTLPAPSSGCGLDFVVKTISATATDYTIVTGSSANIMYGSIANASSSSVYTSAADTITLTGNKHSIGDWIKVLSDGTNWYVSGKSASSTGSTITQGS